jgi:phospholipid/cholesterol/gamma-HCH transport system substrate-binding protein
MNPRYRFKVGLFVFIALVLVAALMVNFSKGLSFFKPTYELKLKATSVGGIKQQASVMMSGVEIGKVVGAELSDDGRHVIVRLKIYDRFKIYPDAEFGVDSLGFLGDQYISIKPTKNAGKPLVNGDQVVAQEAFNLQETAKAAAGFVQRLDSTVNKINEIVGRIDHIVLNETNLNSLSTAIGNFRVASEKAIAAMEGVATLFQTNAEPVHVAVTNLVQFSRRLDQLAADLDRIVNTNGVEITVAVENLGAASANVKALMADIQAGKGLLGGLLKDEQMKTNFSVLLTNVESAAANFSTLGSNINHRGLWRILWKPSETKKPEKK